MGSRARSPKEKLERLWRGFVRRTRNLGRRNVLGGDPERNESVEIEDLSALLADIDIVQNELICVHVFAAILLLSEGENEA